MIASLSFNLPEEQEDFELACKAVKYSIAIEDVKNHLRSLDKYGEQRMYDIGELREKINQIICEALE